MKLGLDISRVNGSLIHRYEGGGGRVDRVVLRVPTGNVTKTFVYFGRNRFIERKGEINLTGNLSR